MAFSKKTWKDRISEEPQRRTLTDTTTGTVQTVDVARAEGVVTQEGDAFSAANMNDLENRIEEGLGSGDILIAGTELTSTASKDYTKGQYLIYLGTLYRAIQAIASGASLVVNTNIKAVKAADEIASHLTVNGKEFYFDYQNGEFGYNTSELRGADTFAPFKRISEAKIFIAQGSGSGGISYSMQLDKGEYYLAPLRWVNTGTNLTYFCNLLSSGSATGWYQVKVTGATVVSAGTFPTGGGTIALEDISVHAGKIRVNADATTVTVSAAALGSNYQFIGCFVVKA